jgi:triosephosphate isomerase (TIM)
MSERTTVIAGNWKLNHGPGETRRFLAAFLPLIQPREDRLVAIFPPSLSLPAAAETIDGHENLLLGVQNIYWESSGAFTGEVSAPLAREAGARLALVGHSERRHIFGESDADTARKVRAALEHHLRPVLCVGEKLDEREAGAATRVVERQLLAALDGLRAADLESILIAYEPVWAIGTGRTASPRDAAEMHASIRRFLEARFSSATSEALPILYGGSVKPENAADLLAADHVDGLLVGGASLDPAGFARICDASA